MLLYGKNVYINQQVRGTVLTLPYKTKYATTKCWIPYVQYLLTASSIIVWSQRISFKDEKSSNRIITWFGYITYSTKMVVNILKTMISK